MIEDRTTIFHGDYKFDNYIFSPGEAKIIAVLDWEVSICRNMSARLIHD
jgi:aminoglycoside phosphotransferase (APT) family kinase protein